MRHTLQLAPPLSAPPALAELETSLWTRTLAAAPALVPRQDGPWQSDSAQHRPTRRQTLPVGASWMHTCAPGAARAQFGGDRCCVRLCRASRAHGRLGVLVVALVSWGPGANPPSARGRTMAMSCWARSSTWSTPPGWRLIRQSAAASLVLPSRDRTCGRSTSSCLARTPSCISSCGRLICSSWRGMWLLV